MAYDFSALFPAGYDLADKRVIFSARRSKYEPEILYRATAESSPTVLSVTGQTISLTVATGAANEIAAGLTLGDLQDRHPGLDWAMDILPAAGDGGDDAEYRFQGRLIFDEALGRRLGGADAPTAVEVSFGSGPAVTVGFVHGPPGPALEMQAGETHIQWRVVGAATWTNLIAIADITGP